MSTRSNDWDEDEREALEPVRQQLRQLQEDHANDPSFDVLRAATADVLPADLQASTAAHLAASRWSRVLVEGANAGTGGLAPDDEARLLARVHRDTASRTGWSLLRPRVWTSLLAAAAVGFAAFAIVQRPGEAPTAPGPGEAADRPRTVPPPIAPQFQLPLDKPDVKISPRALTYRSDATVDDFLSQLKPALDAYRQGDFRRADREFTVLATRYPQAVEVHFYQGVARLFSSDFAAAAASLSKADRLADESFANDVAWYRAVVDERLGRAAEARARLASLCSQANQPRQRAACEAAGKLR